MRMLVSPLPGVDRKHLHQTLGEVCQEASNLYTGGPDDHYERLLAYLDWASDAVDRLGTLISSADLDRLVLTKRYDQLLAGLDNFIPESTWRLAHNLVNFDSERRLFLLSLKRSPKSCGGGSYAAYRWWLTAASTSTTPPS
ncbi:hypothetical protein [Streptomyces sp. B6B3]|uniref:hypothetical protein n=1 Tax=Streptomyces sp. B6B3 TaxID=3153570 RepID=UPI00325F35FE